jgi:hypothetical protein
VGISWEATKSLVSGDGNMIWTVDFHNIPLCGFSDVKFLPFVSPCPQFTVWLLSCSYFPQISFVLILTYNSLLPFPRTWVPPWWYGITVLFSKPTSSVLVQQMIYLISSVVSVDFFISSVYRMLILEQSVIVNLFVEISAWNRSVID